MDLTSLFFFFFNKSFRYTSRGQSTQNLPICLTLLKTDKKNHFEWLLSWESPCSISHGRSSTSRILVLPASAGPSSAPHAGWQAVFLTHPFSPPLCRSGPSSQKLLTVPLDFNTFSQVIFQPLIPRQHAGLGSPFFLLSFPQCASEGNPRICLVFVSIIFGSIVDVQCCVSFCCIAEWFSHTYICSFFVNFHCHLWLYHRVLNIVPCAIQ